MRTFVGLLVAVWIAGPTGSASSSDLTDAKSFELKFGILSEPQPRRYLLKRQTTTIPKCVYADTGFLFGYIIQEKSSKPFRLETVLHLPENPKVLSGALAHQQASRVLRSPPKDLNGSGASGFRFDSGDPSGQYKIEFYVDEKLLRAIEFVVSESCE